MAGMRRCGILAAAKGTGKTGPGAVMHREMWTVALSRRRVEGFGRGCCFQGQACGEKTSSSRPPRARVKLLTPEPTTICPQQTNFQNFDSIAEVTGNLWK